MMLITGARVLTPNGWEVTDVAIDGGSVIALGTGDPGDGGPRLDAAGLWLGPGFVDMHTHLRDPGHTRKEDLASGTAAAAAGGFTAVLAMPNTEPPIDSADVVDRIERSAAARGKVRVAVAGALTAGRRGEEMAHLDDLYEAGVRVFTDDGDCVMDAGLLRRAMQYLADRGDALVAQHAEDPTLSAGGHLHLGEVSRRLGIVGIPASAETVIVARDIALAAETGVRYHVQHLSTADSVEMVRRAKEAGLPVSAEVTPHHLTLTDSDVTGLDTNLKMYPPLRSADDRHALREGLRAGVIDAVATDHAPHAGDEKDVPFEDAPRGVIGLETAFPLALQALEGDLELLFDRMSTAPARLIGLPDHGRRIESGAPSNLVLVDPGATWKPESFVSKSANSATTGIDLKGRVMATIVEGQLVYGEAR